MKALIVVILVIGLAYFLFRAKPPEVQDGQFVPPDDKFFPYQAGDILLSREDGKFGVFKVTRVEKIELTPDQTINVAGQMITAPVSDYLLSVHIALSDYDYSDENEALTALRQKAWMKVEHVPMRPSGLQTVVRKVSHEEVSESELEGYREWKQGWDSGTAGIW